MTCTQVILGHVGHRQRHGDACRARFARLMAEDPDEAVQQRLVAVVARGSAAAEPRTNVQREDEGESPQAPEAKRVRVKEKDEGDDQTGAAGAGVVSGSSSSAAAVAGPPEDSVMGAGVGIDDDVDVHFQDVVEDEPAAKRAAVEQNDPVMLASGASASTAAGPSIVASGDGADGGVGQAMDATSLSKLKATLVPTVTGQLREKFSYENMEVSESELLSIASLCVEMNACDVAEIHTTSRFTPR